MEPRDVFDGILMVLIAAIAYLEVFGFGVSRERLEAIASILANQEPGVYLVVAGVFGVVFLVYVAIWVPARYGRSRGPP